MSELTAETRTRLHRRVRLIVAFTITYNVIEGIVAVWAGVVASSAALIGFGLDSAVEVLSAAAIAWQFTRKSPERWEKVTVRAIGLAFFLLAAYVTIDAILSLIDQEGPTHSPFGLGITALSLIVMPLLAWYEVRTGRELGSKSRDRGCQAAHSVRLPFRRRLRRPHLQQLARVVVGRLRGRSGRRRPRGP